MKFFALNLVFLAMLTGFLKPVDFGMLTHGRIEMKTQHNIFLMNQGSATSCKTILCAGTETTRESASDCALNCIQGALPTGGAVSALISAPPLYIGAIALGILIGLCVLQVIAYALVRYLLYAYTLFHLRFVTSTVLRY